MAIVDPFDTQTNIVDPFDEQPEEQAPQAQGPFISADTNPMTMWEKAKRFFDNPEEEGAKSVQALVDAETFKISPSAAMKYRDMIDRGVEINPQAAALRSTLSERVKQSWEIGKKQNQLGEMGYSFILNGDPAILESMQKINFPAPSETYISEGRLEESVRSAAKMMPMMADAAQEAGFKGVVLGLGFGAISLAAGQPELAPGFAMAGLKMGAAEGAFESAMRKEAGLALSEIINFEDAEGNRIDPDIARAAAFGVGVVNATIEVSQLKTIVKTIPGMDKIVSDAITKTITSKTVKGKLLALARKYGTSVATETGQEVAQESTNIVFEELAKALSNELDGTDIPQTDVMQVFERLKETAVESAKGFAVISAPGTVIEAAGIRKEKVNIPQPVQQKKTFELPPETEATETPAIPTGITDQDIEDILNVPDEEFDTKINEILDRLAVEETRLDTFRQQVSEVVGPEETDAVTTLVEARANAVGMAPDEYLEYHNLQVVSGEEAGKIGDFDILNQEKTFIPREVSEETIPETTTGLLPSKAEQGKYYHAQADQLQGFLDRNGDGFLYRVTNIAAIENGFDVGLKSYKHQFKNASAKVHSFTSSMEDARQILDSLPEGRYIVYRIQPQDLADEFTIQIPSYGDNVIHVQSPLPASTRNADVVYRNGEWLKETADDHRRIAAERRAAATGERRASGLRAEAGQPRAGERRARNPQRVLEQRAFHGTPYKFDKFSLEAIGTGEGAQAFGWGLYFSEAKAVAEYYKDSLGSGAFTYDGVLVEGDSPKRTAIELLWSWQGDKNGAIDDAQGYENTKEIIKEIKSLDYGKIKQGGNVYQVDLLPQESEYLLWDQPIENQPEKVKQALTKDYKKFIDAIGRVSKGERARDVSSETGFNTIDLLSGVGGNIYEQISKEKGSDKKASEYLNSIGIKGIKYEDEISRGEGKEKTYNYVIFDDSVVTIEAVNDELIQAQRLDQALPSGAKASIAFTDTQTIISAFESADVSSLAHELGHLFRRDIGGEDLTIAEEWAGVKDGVWDVDAEEKFARGFERYLAEGEAPTAELQSVFEKFKTWLLEIYRAITGSAIDIEITPEIKGVFDRLLSEQEAAGTQETLFQADRGAKKRIRRLTGQTDVSGTVSERTALRSAFKKAAQSARVAMREGRAEGVAQERARMKEIISAAAQRRTATEEVAKDIKAIQRLAEAKGDIAVEYKKKIKELVSGIDYRRMSAKTQKRLESLADFIDKNGTPLGINQKRVSELKRLSKTPIRELTPAEIKDLRSQLENLKAQGKLKESLKYKYKQRERDQKLQEIKDTTKNLDPHVLPGEDRFRDRVKVAGTTFYLDTLHTPRVAELADNFAKKGPQLLFIKELGNAEQEAISNSIDRETELLAKIQALGVESIEEGSDTDIRMMIVMRYREGATAQAKTLMETYGIKSLPELTEKEEGIIEAIRLDMENNKAGLAAAWEEVEGEIFPEQEVYYLPLKYEKEEEIVPDTNVQGRGRTTHTFDGFSNKRRPGVKKVPRVGILQIYKEAVLEQEWYKNLQPKLEDIKSVVLTEQYKEAAGEVLYSWWKDQIDITARRGWSASAKLNASSGLLRRVRHNINTAILGYKVSTVLLQPFAVFDGIAYANAKVGPRAAGKITAEVLKSFVLPGYTKSLVRESEALKQRQGGELAITEELAKAKGESIKEKLTRNAFKLITQSDLKTAAGVQEAVRKILLEEGMSEVEAKKEAEFMMKMSQGDSSVTFRPHILSQGEGARTWFTFQSFVMNRWGILVHDLLVGKITKDQFKGKVAGLVSLGVLMMAGMAEDDMREWLYDLLNRKELPADNRSTTEKVVVNLISTMPFFGNLINSASSGMGSSPPAVRTAEKGLKGAKKLLTGKDAETRLKGFLDTAESGLIMGVGFPGTAQFFDLLEAALENK